MSPMVRWTISEGPPVYSVCVPVFIGDNTTGGRELFSTPDMVCVSTVGKVPVSKEGTMGEISPTRPFRKMMVQFMHLPRWSRMPGVKIISHPVCLLSDDRGSSLLMTFFIAQLSML